MQIGTLTVQNEQGKNEATKRPNLKQQIILIGGAMIEVNMKGVPPPSFNDSWPLNLGKQALEQSLMSA